MRSWLANYIMGESLPAPPVLEMQLRANKQQREQFDLWPSPRIKPTVLAPCLPAESHMPHSAMSL